MSCSMSISGLQVLLAQNDWYRPTTQDSSTHRSRVKHLSFQLHQWCCALQEVLTSNAAFVFFKVHAERAAASDMRTLSELSKRCAVPFYYNIETFARKHEAHRVLLLVDTAQIQERRGVDGSFSPHAYDLPLESRVCGEDARLSDPQRKGLETFPAIFSFPPEKSEREFEKLRLRHWPTIVSLLTDRTRRNCDAHALRAAGIVNHFEERLKTSYYMYQVDARMAFVVLFEGVPHKGGQKNIVRFLQFVGEALCCRNVMALLKPQDDGINSEEVGKRGGWWKSPIKWFRSRAGTAEGAEHI